MTWGGLELTSDAGVWVAVTGAPAPVEVDGAERGSDRAEWLPAGGRLRLGPPTTGVRSYLAVAGGVDVAPVLGSRSTDTLAWVGPPRVEDGTDAPGRHAGGSARAAGHAEAAAAGPAAGHARAARGLVRPRRARPALRRAVHRG